MNLYYKKHADRKNVNVYNVRCVHFDPSETPTKQV